MPCHLVALSVDANDPLRLARFWAGVLGPDTADETSDGIALLPSDDTGFQIRFLPTEEQKAGQNRVHVDLTSTLLEDQRQTVARALGLGARHIDVGQRPEEGHVCSPTPTATSSACCPPDSGPDEPMARAQTPGQTLKRNVPCVIERS